MKKILFSLRIHKSAINIVITALTSLSLGLFFAFIDNLLLSIFFFTLFILLSLLGTIINIGSSTYYDREKIAWRVLPIIFSELKLSDKTTRITIHCIKKANKEQYIQLTPYYPTGGGQGREFQFTQGITGKVFRTKIASCYSIPEGTTLEDDHLNRWNFTEREIKQLKQDRKSYFAYPIGYFGDYANIVIYADSSDPNCFCENGEIYKSAIKKFDNIFNPMISAVFSIETSMPNTKIKKQRE